MTPFVKTIRLTAPAFVRAIVTVNLPVAEELGRQAGLVGACVLAVAADGLVRVQEWLRRRQLWWANSFREYRR